MIRTIEKLRQFIENRIAGRETVTAEETEETSVIDLMSALKQSLAQKKSAPKKTGRKSS